MRISEKHEHNNPSVEDIIWWSLLEVPSSFIIGSFIAFLFWGTNKCIALRHAFPSLVYYLPVAGLLIFLLRKLFRDNGDSFVLEKIHRQDAGVTERSAFPILAGTFITQLCGGLTGIEGASLQIGASVSKAFAKLCNVKEVSFQMIIGSGIAAAFSAVFGTPLAGAVFALELAGRLHFKPAFVPCIISSIIGFVSCNFFNAQQRQWVQISHTAITPLLTQPGEIGLAMLFKIVVIGISTGLVCCFFVGSKHTIKLFTTPIPKWVLPVAGGGFIILLMHFIPLGGWRLPSLSATGAETTQFNSLFTIPQPSFAWLVILIIVTITLGVNFVGGEITPLMISAFALGNALSPTLGLPTAFAAIVTAIAMFASIANTPLAATLLGVELFGGQYIVHFALVSLIAYFISPVSNVGLHKAEYWPKLFSKKYIGAKSEALRRDTDSSISNL